MKHMPSPKDVGLFWLEARPQVLGLQARYLQLPSVRLQRSAHPADLTTSPDLSWATRTVLLTKPGGKGPTCPPSVPIAF